MAEPAPAADRLPDDDETTPAADLPAEPHATAEETGANGRDIWARVRARVEHRLASIELQAHRLLDRPLGPDEIAQALEAASALTRGLGALQQASLTQLARHLETTLGADHLDATTGVHLAGTIEDLRTMLASAVAQLESAATPAGTVVALGEPDVRFDTLLWVLASRGHRIRHESVRLPTSIAEPAAVVAIVGRELSPAIRTMLQAAVETWSCAVIALHDDAPLSVQRVLAQNASTVLPISIAPDAVAEEIIRHRAGRTARRRALICACDEAQPVLEAHGFDVTVVPRPADLLDVAAHDGTAIVFGEAVPVDLAFDMTRLVRATPASRRAPVVWVGERSDVDVLRAERLGIVMCPRLDDAVAIRVATLMRQAAADADTTLSESGALLSWPAARVLIDRSLVASHRSGAPTSIAAIRADDAVDADHFRLIEETLTREFRRGDVVGRLDDRTFVVALQGAPRRIATNRMSTLVPRLAAGEDTVRVGVAEFPGDGRAADELAEAASAAIRRAAEQGGPQVVPTTWRPVDDRAVDVLIVDPDPVLGEMLAAALAERGYRSDRLTDGHDALERLTEAGMESLPRVLLLDTDIGGIDGLTLLRSLRPAGLLSHMDVLVLSTRAAESDIRLALDLGAADVVRKPMSTTLLLHRVSRLIER